MVITNLISHVASALVGVGGGERERKRRGKGEKKGLRMRGELKWQKQEPGRVGAPASGISKHFSYIPSLCQAR